MFANEVSFSEDPVGLDLAGKLSLLGTAYIKGKQETLAQGTFYGSFSRDGDADLVLAGADKDTVSACAGRSRGSYYLTAEKPEFLQVASSDSRTRVLDGIAGLPR